MRLKRAYGTSSRITRSSNSSSSPSSLPWNTPEKMLTTRSSRYRASDSDLSRLCQRLETLHSGNSTTNALLDKCKTLVSHSNDLSAIRAKYPHDVVNHLSCDEARNHYGGVVSLIPVVLDCIKEWVSHSEKLPRSMMQNVSSRRAPICQQPEIPNPTIMGVHKSKPSFVSEGSQTLPSVMERAQALVREREKRREVKLQQLGGLSRPIGKLLDGPWRPPGKNAF